MFSISSSPNKNTKRRSRMICSMAKFMCDITFSAAIDDGITLGLRVIAENDKPEHFTATFKKSGESYVIVSEEEYAELKDADLDALACKYITTELLSLHPLPVMQTLAGLYERWKVVKQIISA